MAVSLLASTSQVLWRILASEGKDPREVFEMAGLDKRRWQEPDGRFADRDLDRAWATAVQRTGNPCLGLKAAGHLNPASLHAFGFAWLASETLHDGLSRLVRYAELISDGLSLELSVAGNECRLSIDRVILEPTAMGPRLDAFWAALISLCRTLVTPDLSPLSVTLRRPEPSCAAEYFSLFRSPVEFSALNDSMTFDREAAEQRLPTANRALARANDQVIADYLARYKATDLPGQVRARMIELLPAGGLNEAQVANALNVSSRTLQRKLADAGTSYSVLLDDARQELARRFIGEQRLSIKEASYLLGFSEPGNFSRAFRRWTGQAPSRYRERVSR